MPDVGQKPAPMRPARITPLASGRRRSTPSPIVLLVLVLAVLGGVIYFLSSQAREVPTRVIEVDVTNVAGR